MFSRGLSGLSQDQEFFPAYSPMPYDYKPYSPTFGQVSSKSDVAFWKYGKNGWFWSIFDTNSLKSGD